MVGPRERASRRAVAGRINRRPPSFAVTLIALAIVFALGWTVFVRSDSSATAPAMSGIEGTYEWRSTGGLEEDGTFSAVAGGNAGGRSEAVTRGSLDPPSVDSAYDADRRAETTLRGLPARIEKRVGEWPPVWRVATHSPLDYQGLAAIVRTAVEEGDDRVGIKPLEQDDRAVWRAALTLGGKEITLVVDQESGIVTWYSDAEDVFTAHVRWASPPSAGTTYSVDAPERMLLEAGKKTRSTTAYAASPAAAGAVAGYDALVSDLAPDGFALKAVATAPAELRPVSWVSDKVWDLPRGLQGTAILELYTRGLDWLSVEQVGPATTSEVAALHDWQGAASKRLSYQEATLQFGAFKGETALTWYQQSGPSLFVAGARQAVFATGALTRQELIAFAEGLKPVPADGQP